MGRKAGSAHADNPCFPNPAQKLACFRLLPRNRTFKFHPFIEVIILDNDGKHLFSGNRFSQFDRPHDTGYGSMHRCRNISAGLRQKLTLQNPFSHLDHRNRYPSDMLTQGVHQLSLRPILLQRFFSRKAFSLMRKYTALKRHMCHESLFTPVL